MELINIFPVKNSAMCLDQPMNMFLTHLVLSDEFYRETAKKYEGYKILDNSLIEMGGSLDLSDVLRAAEIIGADEIVLPDTFRDRSNTFKQVFRSIKFYKDRLKPYKKMAVVHGQGIIDWSISFERLNALDEIDVLGIPKVLSKDFAAEGGRPYFLNAHKEKTDKEIHLLGLHESLDELLQYDDPQSIRSVDTSLLNLVQLKGQHIFDNRRKGSSIDLRRDELDANIYARKAAEYVRGLT